MIGGLLCGLGVEIRTGVRVTGLETNDHAVVGVWAGGETIPGSVILATGGFERDPRLVKAF